MTVAVDVSVRWGHQEKYSARTLSKIVSWVNYTGKEIVHEGALDRREFGIEKAVGVSALDKLQ